MTEPLIWCLGCMQFWFWFCVVPGKPPSRVWHQGVALCLMAAKGQLGTGCGAQLELSLCFALQSCYNTVKYLGWVGLWGFLWWAPSAKREDHHGVSSGWSSVWHRSNTCTGLSSTQYEQIPIILGVWPFWLTPFFFRSITFWRAYG